MYARSSILGLWTLFVTRSLSVHLYSAPEQLPSKEYDFVIAGGGTAGCVLAARLSEHPDVTVLVVEAGGDNREVFNSIVPFLAATLVNTDSDWNFTTVPQSSLADRSIWFERGHVLGGSSQVNYMAYNRGSNEYYDAWAKAVDDDRWSWSSLESHYKQHSRLVEPADRHDYTSQVIESAHGDGPVEVSVISSLFPLDDRVIKASKDMGDRFRFNQDINAGDSVGFTYTQSSIGGGKRSSAATAYLDPLYNSNRKNLDILIHTHVTKLLQTGTLEGKPDFKAVEVAQLLPGQRLTPEDETTAWTMDNGERTTIHARKEIILSAGVIGTPKILQLSGIGHTQTLTDLGIEAIVSLPDVGKNLTDHPMLPMYWSVHEETIVDDILHDLSVFGNYLQEWKVNKQGVFASGACGTQSYMRLSEEMLNLNGGKDPSSGKLSGHTELLFGEGMIPFTNIPMPKSGGYIFALAVVVSPTSRGDMALKSSDPFAAPDINPNYLATDFDKAAMVQAIHDAFTLLKHPHLSSYVDAPYGPLANLTTDEELLTYTANHAITINHGVGTARMSPVGADWGVVDPDLRVKGVNGVRVVDASVFTEIPEAHTMVPVYILAEKAVDIVLEAHGLLKQRVRDEL